MIDMYEEIISALSANIFTIVIAIILLIFVYFYIRKILRDIAEIIFIYDYFVKKPTKEVEEIMNNIKKEHNVEIIVPTILDKSLSGVLYADSEKLIFEIFEIGINERISIKDKIVIDLNDIIEISKEKGNNLTIKTLDKTYSFILSQPEIWESKLKQLVAAKKKS